MPYVVDRAERMLPAQVEVVRLASRSASMSLPDRYPDHIVLEPSRMIRRTEARPCAIPCSRPLTANGSFLRSGFHNSRTSLPATRSRQAVWSRDYTMKPRRS